MTAPAPLPSSQQVLPSSVRVSRGKSRGELQAQILSIVAELTGADAAVDQPLASQGLDSLASMELRQKLQVQRALTASQGSCTTMTQLDGRGIVVVYTAICKCVLHSPDL